MTKDKPAWWSLIIDGLLLVIVGVPTFVISYIWMHMQAGWAWGEYWFDSEVFDRRYKRKTPP